MINPGHAGRKAVRLAKTNLSVTRRRSDLL
jgi:hypothetical protein